MAPRSLAELLSAESIASRIPRSKLDSRRSPARFLPNNARGIFKSPCLVSGIGSLAGGHNRGRNNSEPRARACDNKCARVTSLVREARSRALVVYGVPLSVADRPRIR